MWFLFSASWCIFCDGNYGENAAEVRSKLQLFTNLQTRLGASYNYSQICRQGWAQVTTVHKSADKVGRKLQLFTNLQTVAPFTNTITTNTQASK